MKKLYLILLMLLILFIPASVNAVAVYQLDQPVKELNNHTLREVFEENIFQEELIDSLNTTGAIFIKNYLPNDLNYIRINLNYTGTFNNIFYSSVLSPTLLSRDNDITTSIINTGFYSIIQNDFDYTRFDLYITNPNITVNLMSHYRVPLTALGIDNLTTKQMDKYYNLYLEAVRFENENIEASQDLGGYQNIFRSIINGVKGLITEMGFVWQWLNAPIITSDMQDFNFIDSIDWSWDLIGVVRQILNSIGILVLQITFWVPSLAFAFMGIPVQVSILSLLFSNLIFLLLGWIMVKSFIL